MKKDKCIVCGEETSHFIQFDHGKLCLCTNYLCTKILNFRANGATPTLLGLVGREDFKEYKMDQYIEDLSDQDLLTAIEETFNASMSFSEALHEAHQIIERNYIKNLPSEELPLLIGNIVYEWNQEYLEDRLKGGKKNG